MPKKRENGTGCRRSMRLLKVDPSGVSLPATPTQPTLIADENVRKCKNNMLLNKIVKNLKCLKLD